MVVLSTVATKLWALLTERGGRYTIEEIKQDLGASQSGVLKALAELEEKGLIRVRSED